MSDLIASTDALSDGQNLLIGQIGLPMFILTTFFPQLLAKLAQHPRLVRLFSIPFAMWIGYEFLAAKIASFWYKLMSNGMSSITISSEDGRLHGSFCRFLRAKKLLTSERLMSATSIEYLKHSVTGGHHRSRYHGSGKPVVFEPINKYQFFWHNKRLFVTTVSNSMSVHVTGMKKQDITVWTFGWSPEPIRSCSTTSANTSTLKPANGTKIAVFLIGAGTSSMANQVVAKLPWPWPSQVDLSSRST
jgi:hypothetical protein